MASDEAKSIAPKMYMAGRGTNEETNTSRPPTSTTPLSPEGQQRPGGGLHLVGGVAASREITRGPPSGSPPTVVR